MNDLILMASHLRERAANCRDMAGAIRSAGIAEELCAVAEDYEGDAARLEKKSDGSTALSRSRRPKRRASGR
jgi:hypothetical protein